MSLEPKHLVNHCIKFGINLEESLVGLVEEDQKVSWLSDRI